MRIGIEAQRIFRKKKHGMDIVVMEIIRELQQMDKTNQYYIFVKEDEDDRVIHETANFKIVKVRRSPYPYWEQVLLPEAAKKFSVDILHSTSNTAPLNCPVPQIVTLHDIIYLEQLNLRKGTYYQIAGNMYRRWNVPRMIKNAAHIITVSDFENGIIRKQFPFLKGRITTIHNGVSAHFKKVDDPVHLEAIRLKYKLPSEFALCLGNTDPKKNIRGLIRSLSLLRQEDRLKTKFVMLDVDPSFLKSISEEINDPDIRSMIVPIGYVPNPELPAIYSLARIFVYPSQRESFGIPILEAMACGTPVLTSNTSSMPEVAGDAAVLIDPFDVRSMAEGIHNLLDDPEKQKDLSERGLQRSAHFSWRNSAIKTWQLYESFRR